MKKAYKILFLVCLVALIAATLAACDPTPGGEQGKDTPTGGVYTVTFDTNGATVTAEALLEPITNVKYGATIDEPLNRETGEPVRPYKPGYTFKYWARDGVEFKFGKDGTQIYANTTLKAYFEANKYYHVPNIYATLDYDAATDTFTVNANGHAKMTGGEPQMSEEYLKDSLGEQVLDDNGKPILVPETFASLDEGEFGSGTTLFSTYGAISPAEVTKPVWLKEDGTADADNPFCFWYYLSEDENGKMRPVQYSEWADATSTATKVKVRNVSYQFENRLTLYAMFKNDLPKVTIEYLMSEEEGADKLEGEYKYTLGDKVDVKEKPADPTRAEYEFDHWYYVYYTEAEKEGDDPVRNVAKFVYQEYDEEGKEINTDATSPMDAAHIDGVPSGEVNFRPITLKLYAGWLKKIEINSADDLNSLRAQIETLSAADASDESSAEQLRELLTAKITFGGDVTLSGDVKPLFDSAHPFEGIIDGGIYDAEGAFSKKTTITSDGGSVVGVDGASLFGYVNGTVKNLRLENISLKITGTPDVAYFGAVATVNRGTITGCDVTGTAIEVASLNKVVFGGIVAVNEGTANDKTKGSISDCEVTAEGLALTAFGFTIGGIVGESSPSTEISSCKATVTVESISATGTQGSYAGVRFGGIAGENGGEMSLCSSTITLKAADVKGLFMLGGGVGQNSGSISRSHANFTLGTTSVAAQVGGTSLTAVTYIGGMIGLNEGYIINSYSVVDINATIDRANEHGAKASVGGLIGYNASGRSDTSSDKEKGVGAINRSYSDGKISVNVKDDIDNATLYVGGIAGYNKHSKNARNFSLVSIGVTYKAAQEHKDLVYAGFLFGMLEDGAEFTSGYYLDGQKITINGKEFVAVATEESEEGDTQETPDDAPEEEYHIGRIGVAKSADSFNNTEFLFGTEDGSLAWTGGLEEGNVWKLDEGAKLPTLADND